MPRKRIFKTREEATEAMFKIVGREVKHYRSDWTEFDEPAILDPGRTEVGKAYIWFTRECGTYLFQADYYDSIRAVIECWGPENIHTRQLTFFEDRVEMIVIDPKTLLDECIKEIKKQTAMP